MPDTAICTEDKAMNKDKHYWPHGDYIIVKEV